MSLSTGRISPSLSDSLLPSRNNQTVGLPWRLVFDRMWEGSIKWLSAKPTYPPHLKEDAVGNQARPHTNPHSLSTVLPHTCLPLSVSLVAD